MHGSPAKSLSLVARLWWLGVWESIQVQRCVVLIVLDKSSLLWPKIAQCLMLNGCIFLGSLVWWGAILKPTLHHAALHYFTPAWGSWWGSWLEGSLETLFNVAWLVPAYLVTIIVSSTWYQELAVLAVRIKSEDKRQLDAEKSLYQARFNQQLVGSAEPQSKQSPLPPVTGHTGPSLDALETAAQELSRSLLFIIFYAEVWALGLVPYVGRVACFFMLSWLYAFFCFDYSWSLSGVQLHERLAQVENNWPFYAGYGAVMSSSTLLLPFYLGASVVAALFPLFTLIACDSNPTAAIGRACKTCVFASSVHDANKEHNAQAQTSSTRHSQASGARLPGHERLNGTAAATEMKGYPPLPRLPVFFAAWWPTEKLLATFLGPHPSTRRRNKA